MTKILLLGSIHFHNDFHSKEPTKDFLESLHTLREKLIQYQPTSIFVESDYDQQESLDEFYRDYDEKKFYKNEAIDVGMYVAKQLNLKSITAMDRMKMDDDTGGFGDLMADLKSSNHPLLDTIEQLQKIGSDYDSNNLMDALLINNAPSFIDLNRQIYNTLISVGSSWEDAVPWLTWWNKRNMVMTHHITNGLREDERVLVIVGSGHIYALEDMLKSMRKYEVIDFNAFLNEN